MTDDLLEHFRRDGLPKLASSGHVIAIAADDPDPDPKQCLEIGAAILLDKPLVVVVPPGRSIGAGLRRAATDVITADISTAAGQQQLMAALGQKR